MSGWWRAWIGMAADPKWLAIGRRAGVAPGMAFAVAFHLIERAAEAEDRGSFEGYDAEAIGCFVGCEMEAVEAIVAALAAKGMTEGERFTAWERRQPKREDDSTDRVRAFRARMAEAKREAGDDEPEARPAERRATARKAAEKRADAASAASNEGAVTQRNAPEAETEIEKRAAAAPAAPPAARAAAAAVSIGDEREKRERSAATDEAVALHGWICAEARSPNGWRGDLGVVRGWLQSGFSAAEIRAGVTAVLARERGQLPTSLRYFEGAIGDRRKGPSGRAGRKADETAIPLDDWPAERWRKPLDLWARMRRERGRDQQDWPDWARWPRSYGPPPDQPGCKAPAEMIMATLAAAVIGETERLQAGARR